MAIAFSESSFNYDVIHKDKITFGIGGIKRNFYDIKHTNTLMAIEQVWEECLRIKNNDFNEALKHYKGTKTNYKSYYITMRLYERLNKIKIDTHNKENR